MSKIQVNKIKYVYLANGPNAVGYCIHAAQRPFWESLPTTTTTTKTVYIGGMRQLGR